MCWSSLPNNNENADIQKFFKLVERLGQPLSDNPVVQEFFGDSFVQQQLCHIKIFQFAWEQINKIFWKIFSFGKIRLVINSNVRDGILLRQRRHYQIITNAAPFLRETWSFCTKYEQVGSWFQKNSAIFQIQTWSPQSQKGAAKYSTKKYISGFQLTMTYCFQKNERLLLKCNCVVVFRNTGREGVLVDGVAPE